MEPKRKQERVSPARRRAAEALAQVAKTREQTSSDPTRKVLDYLYAGKQGSGKAVQQSNDTAQQARAKIVEINSVSAQSPAAQLGKREQKLYRVLHDLSHGAGRETCIANLPELAEATGFSMSGVQYVVRRLELKGVIVKLQLHLGRGKQQGVEYQVNKVPESLG